MNKKNTKQNPIVELENRLQELNKKRLQAYSAQLNGAVITQLDNMIAETQLELYTEVELEKNRRKDDDGEQWIV